jgi:hypothetical protein
MITPLVYGLKNVHVGMNTPLGPLGIQQGWRIGGVDSIETFDVTSLDQFDIQESFRVTNIM